MLDVVGSESSEGVGEGFARCAQPERSGIDAIASRAAAVIGAARTMLAVARALAIDIAMHTQRSDALVPGRSPLPEYECAVIYVPARLPEAHHVRGFLAAVAWILLERDDEGSGTAARSDELAGVLGSMLGAHRGEFVPVAGHVEAREWRSMLRRTRGPKQRTWPWWANGAAARGCETCEDQAASCLRRTGERVPFVRRALSESSARELMCSRCSELLRASGIAFREESTLRDASRRAAKESRESSRERRAVRRAIAYVRRRRVDLSHPNAHWMILKLIGGVARVAPDLGRENALVIDHPKELTVLLGGESVLEGRELEQRRVISRAAVTELLLNEVGESDPSIEALAAVHRALFRAPFGPRASILGDHRRSTRGIQAAFRDARRTKRKAVS